MNRKDDEIVLPPAMNREKAFLPDRTSYPVFFGKIKLENFVPLS